MENRQNPTDSVENQTVTSMSVGRNVDWSSLSPQQQAWIDYCAVQGLMTDEFGNMKTVPINAFAVQLGVHRDTLYDWKTRIPNFTQLVTKRRKEIAPISRVQKVWNGIYMRAVTGDPRSAALYLANHDPTFRMPQHEVKHEAGNTWAKLLAKKRDRKIIESQNIPEGELIDATPSGPIQTTDQ